MKRLRRSEGYRFHPMYSGIPSNTPAFQGELFFGQSQCVPAFQFLDREADKVFTMFEKDSAETIEKKLLEQGPGLLAGGSAYANIFAGGAAEAHICASAADWLDALKAWNPYSILISLLLSPYSIIRGVFLCIFEVVLSLIDVLRGVFSGHDLLMELPFIFTRVFSSILVREISTAHACMDIYRGLPVIQLNFFGYDEQAHRRGPSTRFAYWSLSGIDSAIKKIWMTAAHAEARHYDVWVYSDHGQEAVVPFEKQTGINIRRAIEEIFYEKNDPESFPMRKLSNYGNHAWGDTVMGRRAGPSDKSPKDEKKLTVTTLGPICQIYFPNPCSDDQKKDFTQILLEKYPMIPLIAIPLENKEVEYRTPKGIFQLPRHAKEILGEHPYLEAVIEDLECLLKHDHRGDLMIFGWSAGMKAISFSKENGAHAGFGPRETQAFAFLPEDALLHSDRNWVRAYDLRQSALKCLGRLNSESKQTPPRVDRNLLSKLRVMSYNVHSCVGMDGILSPDRIARVIAKSNPDIVALQELDAGRKIKGGDQAMMIAKELGMDVHFHPVCGSEPECFGNAILSRFPMEVIRKSKLPILRKSSFLEPRGILWVEVDFYGQKIHIVNTHLSIWAPELKLQVQHLAGPDVLEHPEMGKNLILCGDFNMVPGSKFYRHVAYHLKTPKSSGGKEITGTWPSQWPIRRLDHIFMRHTLKATWLDLPRTRLEKYASDHLPIVADFEIVS